MSTHTHLFAACNLCTICHGYSLLPLRSCVGTRRSGRAGLVWGEPRFARSGGIIGRDCLCPMHIIGYRPLPEAARSEPSSPHFSLALSLSPHSRIMHKPAALELRYTAHRIAEALRHYPEDADETTQARWEHGLGREMVSHSVPPAASAPPIDIFTSGLQRQPWELWPRIPSGARMSPQPTTFHPFSAACSRILNGMA